MNIATAELESKRHDILIADDNPENLKVLGGFLRDEGFNIRVARDGQQALDSVAADPPELILLDIHMPVMDGYETCQRLKSNNASKDIPVIFLSALGETFNKVHAFESGGADYIVKPFELEEVRVRVNVHLMAARLLAETRAGFRASFEQAAVGMLHVSLEGIIREANGRAGAMLDMDSGKMRGQHLPAPFTGELGQGLLREVERFRAGDHEPSTNIWECGCGENSRRWCRVTCSFVQIGTNQAPYAAIILEDITAWRQAEDERRQLAAAVEASPDAIAITESDGRICYVNTACEKLRGVSRAELLGQELPLFRQAPGGTNGAAIQDCVAQEGSWHGIEESVKPSGNTLVEEHHVWAVTDHNGTVLNYIAHTRDISRQRSLEGQLRQSQKMEAMGTLAAGIAHDFNNLLAAILGFTELSIDDVEAGSETEANLREVVGAAGRARELVRQILTFGRQSDYEVRPIDLTEAIEDVLRLLRRMIPPTVEIQTELDRNCPPVMADNTALHQILMNLCTNAYHAMEANGGVLTVRLAANLIDEDHLQGHPELSSGMYARVSVSDTGHGMDEATRQRHWTM